MDFITILNKYNFLETASLLAEKRNEELEGLFGEKNTLEYYKIVIDLNDFPKGVLSGDHMRALKDICDFIMKDK